MGIVILIIANWIVLAVISIIISDALHYYDEYDVLIIMFSIFLAPIAIITLSYIYFLRETDDICRLCDKFITESQANRTRKITKYYVCNKCIKSKNIKDEYDMQYHIEVKKMDDEKKEKEIEQKIKVMKSLRG